MSDTINASHDFASHRQDVLGASMHYLDEGEGNPILFIHGIPTSSYLWRNVLPYLTPMARCIAVDLIGMGASDKPDIDYTLFDHIEYLTAFIDNLQLDNLTLVMHGWGSVIGFHYAMENPQKIKALAVLEGHVRPNVDWSMVSLPVQELAEILSLTDGGHDIIMNSNYYVNKVMPMGVMRRLNDEEMKHYSEPFNTPGGNRPIWQYLQDLPLGREGRVLELIKNYSDKLCQSALPKLLMYALPGFNTTMDTVVWAKESLPHLTLVDIGEALHYAQESNPQAIGEAISAWYSALLSGEL